MLALKVKRLRRGVRLPSYMTAWAAGLDLSAAVDEPLSIEPGERAVVPTGIAIELPADHEGQVRPRSGLAARLGLSVLNAPGTIDGDYRGEIKVILVNMGDQRAVITNEMRIAQLVVAPVARVEVVEVDKLSGTARGDGGFGHTG